MKSNFFISSGIDEQVGVIKELLQPEGCHEISDDVVVEFSNAVNKHTEHCDGISSELSSLYFRLVTLRTKLKSSQRYIIHACGDMYDDGAIALVNQLLNEFYKDLNNMKLYSKKEV